MNSFKKYFRLWSYYKEYFRPSLGATCNSFKNSKFYLSDKLYEETTDEIHLKSAMNWLARAQDICQGKGVSAVYYLNRGWDVAYPETSGYIIGTFLEYSKLYGDTSFFERAVTIGDWEIEIQTNNGGILSNPTKTHVRVFNTGQVILGWCLLYEKTGNTKYLEAASEAGDFLCRSQENDGRWLQNTYCGARTYHARIDWALLRLFQLTRNKKYLSTGIKNIKWVLDQQRQNGWFENCGFDDDVPIMHVIVYTLRGLLECSDMNIEPIHRLDITSKLKNPVDHINEFITKRSVQNERGFIPTSFQNNWLSQDSHSCLTGNAQYAIFLYRLSQITADNSYAEYADILVAALKRTQKISGIPGEKNISGAIPGSYPMYIGYQSNSFPNWATKFFADSIMMKNHYEQGLIIKA